MFKDFCPLSLVHSLHSRTASIVQHTLFTIKMFSSVWSASMVMPQKMITTKPSNFFLKGQTTFWVDEKVCLSAIPCPSGWVVWYTLTDYSICGNYRSMPNRLRTGQYLSSHPIHIPFLFIQRLSGESTSMSIHVQIQFSILEVLPHGDRCTVRRWRSFSPRPLKPHWDCIPWITNAMHQDIQRCCQPKIQTILPLQGWECLKEPGGHVFERSFIVIDMGYYACPIWNLSQIREITWPSGWHPLQWSVASLLQ